MRPSGWTLRRRLLLVIAALLAATSLVIGVVSVLALRSFLNERVDDQLRAAVQRSQANVARPGPMPGGHRFADNAKRPGPDFLLAPGQGPDTVAALIRDDSVQGSAVLDDSGTPRPLTALQDARLVQVPLDDAPRTIDLAGDLGDYRAVAVAGRGDSRLVIALPLQSIQAAVSRQIVVVSTATAIGLLIAVVVGAFVVRSTLRPLRRVATTATRVAQLPLHAGEVSLAERVPARDTDPRTEVGQVGASLNQMLEHIEAALSAREKNELRTRQFVADASHELRTPLAAILGYAELTRRGPHDLPPDVVHAMARVESEAHRMSGLVQDLLLLARLDTAPGLHLEKVDLRRLLTDVVSDAHASGPGHEWTLDLPDDEVFVAADADRLHQAVTNLLSNARTHTPPGTVISVGLTRSKSSDLHDADDEVVVSVADDGPGIPSELQSSVFERFARGDSSRSRRAGSTGLGLAIVAAIVHAHGGVVSLDSRPGKTTFTVALPGDSRRKTHSMSPA